MKTPYAAIIGFAGAAALAALAVLAPAAEEKKAEPADAGWTPLFNGKDLTGWKPEGTALWSVEDGCLLGTQTDGKGGNLYTEKHYDNFECRFTYRVVWPANSGIWFRDKYQFDILKYKNPLTYSGALYYPGCPTTFAFVNLDESIENRDGWNEGQVYANGDKFIHWLNGRKIGEATVNKIAKGKVGVQVHPGAGFKGMQITIKSIEIRPLAKDEAPTPPPAPKKEK